MTQIFSFNICIEIYEQKKQDQKWVSLESFLHGEYFPPNLFNLEFRFKEVVSSFHGLGMTTFKAGLDLAIKVKKVANFFRVNIKLVINLEFKLNACMHA